MRVYSGLCLSLLLLAAPARATLYWAPATGVNLTNSAGNTAQVEVRGHGVYSKTAVAPPAPPGYFSYSVNTHDSTVCGNTFCAAGQIALYYRFKCNSGAGTLLDALDVQGYEDERIYIGSGSYATHWNVSIDITFLTDGDIEESDFSGWSGVSNQAISYQIGIWQGGATGWVSRTSTGAL